MATHRETITLYPSAFVSGSYSSITNQNNPVGKGSNSTSYVNAYIRTGNSAASNLVYAFDCSSIPAEARITSVTCTAKAYISNTQSNRIATRNIQLYSGTTAKGSAHAISTSTTAFSITCGTWTREELDSCLIRIDIVRGTNNTTTNYYVRFYGATLTISYEWDDAPSPVSSRALLKVGGTWKEGKVYKKISGRWVEQDASESVFTEKIYIVLDA